MHIAEPLVPEPSSFEVEIAIEKDERKEERKKDAWMGGCAHARVKGKGKVVPVLN
jgi:hypothetical protein